MPSKFLQAFSPLIRITPEVKPPTRRVSLREKLGWTLLVMIIYIIMSNIPLYGIPHSPHAPDVFYSIRVVLASSRGTLTELGIGPIVTAGLLMQVLVGSRMIDIDLSDPEDRALFTGVQKVLAILLTMVQAVMYIASGAYGRIAFNTAVLIFFQLLFAGIIIILMDEMIQKGWGIGSGVSIFIIAGVADRIMWNAFSPFSIPNGDGYAYGAVIAFFQAVGNAWNTGKWNELISILNRGKNLPDMTGVITTIILFIVIVYIETCRIEIPVAYSRFRGIRGTYPIRLMYVSVIPVIFAQAFYAIILFTSQLTWRRWGDSENAFLRLIVDILGRYEITEEGIVKPTTGLAYYLSPPRGIQAVIEDPVRAVTYMVLFLILCVIFGVLWVEVSGMAPADIAKQLVQAGLQVPGFRSSERILERIFKRYIPPVTIFSGILIGLLAVFADFLGALGTGVGILLFVDILYQYYQLILREQLAELHPAVRAFLGLE
ncbi:MAG: preprotein translocase subunit SecY [Candidatus Baldrarchaeia archaeon]